MRAQSLAKVGSMKNYKLILNVVSKVVEKLKTLLLVVVANSTVLAGFLILLLAFFIWDVYDGIRFTLKKNFRRYRQR